MEKRMKKIIALSSTVLLSGSLVHAGYFNTPAAPAQTASVSTAVAGQTMYDMALAKIKTNIPIILSSVKILLPKVQAIVNSSATGGFMGFFSSVTSAAMDGETRSNFAQLATTIGETVSPVIDLASAPTSVKQDARGILASFTKDADVKNLMSLVQKVPIVGTMLYDNLQELINKISKV
jgi:hypothetical protein